MARIDDVLRHGEIIEQRNPNPERCKWQLAEAEQERDIIKRYLDSYAYHLEEVSMARFHLLHEYDRDWSLAQHMGDILPEPDEMWNHEVHKRAETLEIVHRVFKAAYTQAVEAVAIAKTNLEKAEGEAANQAKEQNRQQ